MKILITGCTPAQSSSGSMRRTVSFTSLLYDAFETLGHEVFLTKPYFNYSKEYLNQYDLIFVGIASPSGLSAHYSHGAFALANKARELGKLRLVIDSPNVKKIKSTVQDFYNNPNNFYKDFYSKRIQYDQACKPENKEQISAFVSYLHNEKWAQTFVPSMPWFSKNIITKNISNLDEDSIIPLCFDRFLIDGLDDRITPVSKSYWCADSIKTPWTVKTIKSLTLPVYSTKNNNYSTNQMVIDKMSNSVGTLVSTYQNGDPWWSIAISQSLIAGVPIVTEWRHTAELGAEWAYLPSTVEEMSPKERMNMAQSQKDFYREAVPSYTDSLEKTARALDNQSQLLLL